MNILFYLTRFPGIGGIETVTWQIIKQLTQKAEYHIDIISHRQQTIKTEECISGFTLFRMPNDKYWLACENISFANEIVKKGNYNVIIYQDSYAPTEKIVCQLSYENKIPLIVFEHNSPLFIYNKRELTPWWSLKGCLRRILHPYLLYKEKKRKRMLLRHAFRYVLLSETYIPEFCNFINFHNNGKVIYINNPVRLSSIEVSCSKENILLYVGRLVVEKGVDKMLYVWNEISKNLSADQNWQFVIVGDGVERFRLEKLAKSLQLRNVIFEGFQNPKSYYERAKIFFMMSKYEGWGLTLCEAMTQGVVPIVLNSFSAAQDLIKDGYNGYLVSDKKDFYHHLLQLINNPYQLIEMSNNAIEQSKKYNISNIIPHWEALLAKCR